MSEPPSSSEPWEDALKQVTLGLGREARVMLDMETRESLEQLLRKGWQRAVEQERADDYDDAAATFANVLTSAVIIGRDGLTASLETTRSQQPQASISQLPPTDFQNALRSLCPGFWPFC